LRSLESCGDYAPVLSPSASPIICRLVICLFHLVISRAKKSLASAMRIWIMEPIAGQTGREQTMNEYQPRPTHPLTRTELAFLAWAVANVPLVMWAITCGGAL